MSWPEKFDSIYVAPRYYERFKTLPERAEPEISEKLCGIAIIADPYMPEKAAAVMYEGQLVGWIELTEEA